MAQFLVATVSGDCSACGERILRGEQFAWGKARGARVCVDCAGGAVPIPQAVVTEWTGERVRRAPARKLSALQQAAVDFVTDPSKGSLALIAKAGAGKTTTLVEMTAVTPGDVVAVAFNGNIAKEMQDKLPEGVLGGTFHSFWWRVLTASGRCGTYPKVVDGKIKTRGILRDGIELGEFGEAEIEAWGSDIAKLISLAKGEGIGVLEPNLPAAWNALVAHHDVSFDTPEGSKLNDGECYERAIEIATLAFDVHTTVAAEKGNCDFDDQLYLPLLWSLRPQVFDFVYVDEAQDFNRVQRALARRMLKVTGRLIAVGDPDQAIYGFRGAASDSIDKIIAEFGCDVLPLNESFRCPQAVVREAQKYCSDIIAAEGAAEGRVEDYTADGWSVADFDTVNAPEQGDLVLCRNTAPLVGLAYRCLARGVAARIIGREIGDGLVSLIRRFRAKSIDSLTEKLAAYREREVGKLVAKGAEDKAQAIDDKCDAITALVGYLPDDEYTVAGLIGVIETIFNGKTGVTLSTIHRAKGREAQRVFILDAHLMPSRWARQQWQKEQERHLQYVATTRSLSTLIYIDSETIE